MKGDYLNMTKKILSTIALGLVSIFTVSLAVPYALPTTYSGYRSYSYGNYYSHTSTNGYEQGSNVTNTVMAKMSSNPATANYSTKIGSNSVKSSAAGSGNAVHGVGTGNSVTYTWTAN